MRWIGRLAAISACAMFLAGAAEAVGRLDQPPDSNQVPYAPEDGEVVWANPPAFVWVPIDAVEEEGYRRTAQRFVDAYVLQYSTSPDFERDMTTTIEAVEMSVYTPSTLMEPGQWYWRYGIEGENGETVFSRVRAFVIPENAQEFPRPEIEDVMARIPTERPRVAFTPHRVEEIRANADGRYRDITPPVIDEAERILAMAEPLAAEPVPPEDPDEARQAYVDGYRAIKPSMRRMSTCALAYVYTGDERFAEEAKRRLLHFATWDVDGPTSVMGVSGTRWYGEFGMGLAQEGPRTFDWIYDTLSEAERETCLDVYGRRVAQMNIRHRAMPFESRPFASHPGRHVGFVLEGSIVFAHDVPEAQDWLDYTLRLLWSVYPAWGGPDGAWHEGISYWQSYITKMSWIASELDRFDVPWKQKPFVRNTGYFGLYCAYPHRPTRAFGDGHDALLGSGAGQLMYTLASFFDNPYFRWHADQYGVEPPPPMIFNVHRPEMEGRSPADLPHAQVFPSNGWVAMHSNMAEPDDNILLLFKSNPRGSVSHDHASQNAFVLEAYRQPLAISSGYRQIHGSPHHRNWMQQTKAHNSILVDGIGQVARSHEAGGAITAFDNCEEFAYTIGNATEAYGGRLEHFERHILFSRPDYFVIIDELEARQPATYQWLLHAQDEMEMDEEAQEVLSDKDGARLLVRFLAPGDLSFSQTDEFCTPTADPAPAQYHFTASADEPAVRQRIVTVLMPHREGEDTQLLETRLLEADGGLAIEVGDEVVLWRDLDAESVAWNGITSSGRISVYRRTPDALERVFHSDGDTANRSETPM